MIMQKDKKPDKPGKPTSINTRWKESQKYIKFNGKANHEVVNGDEEPDEEEEE